MMNVVARFCLFLTLLTTFQSNVHALNGNDDDKNGQTAARQPKWQPGRPDDVCTRPTQPREWEAHLPHKHQLQTPTQHFGWCGGVTTQRCYVERYVDCPKSSPGPGGPRSGPDQTPNVQVQVQLVSGPDPDQTLSWIVLKNPFKTSQRTYFLDNYLQRYGQNDKKFWK